MIGPNVVCYLDQWTQLDNTLFYFLYWVHTIGFYDITDCPTIGMGFNNSTKVNLLSEMPAWLCLLREVRKKKQPHSPAIKCGIFTLRHSPLYQVPRTDMKDNKDWSIILPLSLQALLWKAGLPSPLSFGLSSEQNLQGSKENVSIGSLAGSNFHSFICAISVGTNRVSQACVCSAWYF